MERKGREGNRKRKGTEQIMRININLFPKFFLFFHLCLFFKFFIMKLLTSCFLEIDTLTKFVLNFHLQK